MTDLFASLKVVQDWRLISLSLFICILSAFAASVLLERVERRKKMNQIIWLFVLSVVTGIGIWATHFVALLGYETGPGFSFVPKTIIQSLLIMVCFALPAFTLISSHRSRMLNWFGALILGLGIPAMHFSGLNGQNFEALASRDLSSVVLSIVAGVVLTTIAMEIRRAEKNQIDTLSSAIFLTLAIAAVHFFGMSAATFAPTAEETGIASGLSPAVMGAMIGAIVIVLLQAVTAAAIFDSKYFIKEQSGDWQLSKYETLLESMGEVAKIGGWELDVETMKPAWSPQTCALHRVDEDYEPSLELASCFFPGQAKDFFLRAVHQACREGKGFDIELPFSSYENEQLFVRVVCKMLKRDGHPPKLIGAYQDITRHKIERTALENALVEAGKANRLKSEFLANMSHEIRTPMNGVLGMTQLLKNTEMTDKQHSYADVILSSGRSLLALINDILDTSKIEAGLLQLHNEPFDLKELLTSAKGAVAGIALQKQLSVTTHMEPSVASHYIGDAPRIRQILINLMGNGLKFTETGGVSITASLDKANFLRFEVTDTGPGIPPDQQDHIFGRFNQADGSTTRKHGGTGLGLAISHDLIKLMGGNIGIYSQLGEGSTFWFRIPLKPANVEAVAA